MNRPSALIAGAALWPFAEPPSEFTETTMGDCEVLPQLALKRTALPVPTLKGTEFETPPPGAGFNTVTSMVAFDATSEFVTDTVNCVEFTNVVVRVMPLNATVELAMKLEPLTVRIPPGGSAPLEDIEGESEEIAGTGLLGGVIVKARAVDAPPPGAGLTTVTCAVPAVAMSWALIDTESWVLLVLKVVGRGELFQ